MPDCKPLVSIGMPVFNEAPYLAQALESLLSQQYDNFELIICDNASEDTTQQICRDYMLKDSRIRYFRHEVNLGAVRNFNRVCELASGKYFMWAAGHDLWHPAFIDSCLDRLLDDPSVTLCYPQLVWIDSQDTQLTTDTAHLDTRGLPLVIRFLRVVWGINPNAIYGLIRKSALERTRLVRHTMGPDQVLLAELSVLGPFVQVQRPLFYRRVNRPAETRDQAFARRLSELWGTQEVGRPPMPFWKFTREIIAGASHVSSGRLTKMALLSVAVPFTYLRFSQLLLGEAWHNVHKVSTRRA